MRKEWDNLRKVKNSGMRSERVREREWGVVRWESVQERSGEKNKGERRKEGTKEVREGK